MSTATKEWEDFVTFCAQATTCPDEEELSAPQVTTLEDARLLREDLEQRVGKLPEVCRVIIGLYFCRGLALEQIGDLIQVPRTELERLFDTALRTMRESGMPLQEGTSHG